MPTSSTESAVPIVTVRGAAVLEVQPELAVVAFTVTARDKQRANALRDLAQHLRGLREILERYETSRIDDGAMSVSPVVEKRRTVGFVATMRLSAEFTRFDDLGDLLLRAGESENVSVAGPYWSLRPQSAHYAAAKREAVNDARRNADLYASAAGGALTGSVEISDFEPSVAPKSIPMPMPPAPGGMLTGGSRSSVADETTIDVTPQVQRVYASVNLRYTMSQPPF